MATATQIKDRIVALWARLPGIAYSTNDYPAKGASFPDAQLPAVVTTLMIAPATRRPMSSGIHMTRRVISCHLLVTNCTNTDVLEPNTTEMLLCEPFLDSATLYFAQHPRLHADFVAGEGEDPDLPALPEMVYDTEPMGDSGIILIQRAKLSWWGIVFTLPVSEEMNY